MASTSEGRFQRFWLNLPAEAVVAGNASTMTTEGGLQLVVTTLLPGDAAIASEPAEPLVETNEPAIGEPMQFRLQVEALGGPREARFLHVLQGADAGTVADPINLVESSTGPPLTGVVVAGTAVLFPVDVGVEVSELIYAAPAGTTRHLVTGLVPGAGYDVETQAANGELAVTIRAGASQLADAGGVLVVETRDA